MTADEFVKRYAELATPVEVWIAHHYPEGYAHRKFNNHFCRKRPKPIEFPYTHQDIILDLLRLYEVERGGFNFVNDLSFCPAYLDDEDITSLFGDYNAIYVGTYQGSSLVINQSDGAIELRYTETPEPESVYQHHGYRCALNGEKFLEAGLYYTQIITPMDLKASSEDRWQFNAEENLKLKEIAATCTDIAGGEQFADYWYYEVCGLDYP